ncbi:bifunctional SulP family inorganic anion transporter/carbonic anhydrase [Confluentibacter flavum]|uniref:Sulfate transporter n=1 Tax=Confluentibacter flavum TaxID=1909700 RepID=A0A2N3HIP8_9FLAO|nr:SulP family inorganic anion transporter [Confluentibacter flavum]PKQ44773.1 sulfate transporter [Confluentibacter flavum]
MKKIPVLKNFVNRQQFQDDYRSMFSKLDKDIPAGIVVFLVALPLCLGIALASGAPLISGLISGIIGGVVIGYLSKSGTSISGPAASVSAVVLLAIKDLGSFQLFLGALIIAGIIQVVLGVVKAGILADYMPKSIIKGLLAGIGIILILSQLPYTIGYEFDKSKTLIYSEDYWSNVLYMLSEFLNAFTIGAIVISIISLGILIYWDKTPLKNFKLIPPALVVVILGVLLNQLFKYALPFLYLDGIHLVNIPEVDSIRTFFTFPDFTGYNKPKVWTTALTIAIIASISTLLNIEATDNIDKLKRRTPPNRELIAQGIGNTLSGFLGGIAITSVIVRSSVNIEAGAQTKLSTIIHGFLLLLSVLFLSHVLNLIPLASLAAILLVVGYKLASVSVFKNLYKRGWNQFLPFVLTVVFIVVTDVLTGVLIGSALSIFFLLRSNYYNPFYIENIKYIQDEVIKLELSNEVSFFNKASIRNTLWSVPDNSKVLIDATFTSYIDPDVIDILNDFQNTVAVDHNIDVNIIGLKDSYVLGEEIDFYKKTKAEIKAKTTPKEILEYLKEGSTTYASRNLMSRKVTSNNLMDHLNEDPLAVVVTSVDLREPLNMMLNTAIGDLVSLRSAGHILDNQSILNLEISCRDQGAKLVLFYGNSDNEVIKKALKNHLDHRASNLSLLVDDALKSTQFSNRDLKSESLDELSNEIVNFNIEKAQSDLVNNSSYFKEALSKGTVGIASAFFNRDDNTIVFSELYSVENS